MACVLNMKYNQNNNIIVTIAVYTTTQKYFVKIPDNQLTLNQTSRIFCTKQIYLLYSYK